MRRRQFNKRMTVSTYTTTADGMGGVDKTDLPATGIVPCRCEAMTGDERQIWRQEGVDVTHHLWCPTTVFNSVGDVVAVDLNEIKTVRIGDTEYDVEFVHDRGIRTRYHRAVATERKKPQ